MSRNSMFVCVKSCLILTSFIWFCSPVKYDNEKKRLLLNDPDAINAQFLVLEKKLQEVNVRMGSIENENSQLRSELAISRQQTGGAFYIRWGRKDCPAVNGTNLVYSGIAGGGAWKETGGGTNYLCLPHDPDFAQSDFPIALQVNNYKAHVWGAEYQFAYGNVKVDDDVPCAACLDTNAVTSVMIPGKNSCPATWKKQYGGFLCANHYGHAGASEYSCVDENPQYFEGRRQNLDGKLFFPVITVCGSLPCPPYESSKYLKCVVCSR